MIISRLRIGYTNFTQGYIRNDEIRPLCTDCYQDITVEKMKRSRSNISSEALGNNKEEAKMVIK
jgi:transposase-like protein